MNHGPDRGRRPVVASVLSASLLAASAVLLALLALLAPRSDRETLRAADDRPPPAAVPVPAAPATFNYAEAMQKSLYFYEAQQSGRLSPNNRVAWRGPACLNDGKDIGRDLSGGWFDAGDHWTANLTMAWAALCLATSANDCPKAWRDSGQMDELLEELVHVGDYFSRCVLNPDEPDPAALEVAIGCGGGEGVPNPSVHGEWGPAETCDRLTNRPTFRLTKAVPGGDIPAAMAAALAASAVAVRDHADALKGKKGFERFDAAATADRWLTLAAKLYARGERYQSKADNQGLALRSDGKVVKTGYRSDAVPDKLLAAAAWLARAHAADRDRAEADRWLAKAKAVHEGPYRKEGYDDWWRDNSLGFFGKAGALALARADPSYEPAHRELQFYACRFLEYYSTPAGLRLREKEAHQWGSLRHANNAAMIALLYTDLIDRAPPLTGNTHWLKGRSKEQLKAAFLAEGKRQVDYALGANPYGRSYLIGYGNDPFDNPHHRGAYGGWAGFEHLIAGKPEYRPRCRHILYGALVGGPDNQDVFTGKRTPSGDYVFGHPTEPGKTVTKPKAGYKFDPADKPLQLIEDPQYNEVAIDYNAAFTVNLAFLQGKGLGRGGPLPDDRFPPKIERNESDDLLTTDREFFASGRLVKDGPDGCEVELTVWNRSRWPARVTEQLAVRLALPAKALAAAPALVGNAKAKSAVDAAAGVLEVSFPGVAVFPGQRYQREDDFERVTIRFGVPAAEVRASGSLAKLGGKEIMLTDAAVLDAGKVLGGRLPAK
jgi:hypothetical protein